jgi:hypothetical protein
MHNGTWWHFVINTYLVKDYTGSRKTPGPKFVRLYLTAIYNSCWIGWGRPVAWTNVLLDLTPMDFLLGHIKALIYMSPVDSDEDLTVCITEATAAWYF